MTRRSAEHMLGVQFVQFGFFSILEGVAMRARMWLPVGLLVLLTATVWTARSTAQVAPCDATCVDIPNPAACSTWITYNCTTCLLLRPCRGFGIPGTQVCWDFAEEGTKVTHQVCQGVHSDSWSAALCGQCYD